jgi:hypothetical protein
MMKKPPQDRDFPDFPSLGLPEKAGLVFSTPLGFRAFSYEDSPSTEGKRFIL